MNQSIKLEKGEHSNVGRVREENQDRITSFKTDYGDLFIVADGMGGHRGGATAASMVINGFEDFFRNTQIPPGTTLVEALRLATKKTNQTIFNAANAGNPETVKMGSTVVVAVWRQAENELVVGHVGDSRAYLFRAGALSQVSHDHSLVQRYIDAGMMSENDGRQHPDAGVLTRSMGQKPDVEMDIKPPVKIQDGDFCLLCSDGLCGYVDDSAIARAINENPRAQAVADRLLGLALEAGGEDNVSLICLQFGDRKPLGDVSVSPVLTAAAPNLGAPPPPTPAAPPVASAKSLPQRPTAAAKGGDPDNVSRSHRLFLLLLIPTVLLCGVVIGILLDHYVLAPPPAPSAKPSAGATAPVAQPTAPAGGVSPATSPDLDRNHGSKAVPVAPPAAPAAQPRRTSSHKH